MTHALVWGLVLSAALSLMLFVLLWFNPELMLNDYPPDVRAKHGPMSARTTRQKTPVSLLFLAVVAGIVALSVRGLPADPSEGLAFGPVFGHFVVMFSVFNVVDLLVIDAALVLLKPRFAILPGTEGLAGYDDFWFHVRGFAIGTVGIVLLSAVLAGLIALGY